MSVSIEGSIKNFGSVENIVKEVKVMRGGANVSGNYTFGEHVNGSLKIYKRNITLESESKSFTYDGEKHN